MGVLGVNPVTSNRHFLRFQFTGLCFDLPHYVLVTRFR